MLQFLKSLMNEFKLCDTPFCDGIVNKLRNFAIALIPIAVIIMVSESISEAFLSVGRNFSIAPNIGQILLIVFIFVLVLIFKYGTKLQQENDETV